MKIKSLSFLCGFGVALLLSFLAFRKWGAERNEEDARFVLSKSEQAMTMGIYPKLAAATSRANLALSVYKNRTDAEVMRKACARSFAEFLEVSAKVLQDDDLRTLWDKVKIERAEVADFLKAHPELEEANQAPDPTPPSGAGHL